MRTFIRIADRVLRGLLMFALLLLVVCVVWQVSSRYVSETPSTFTDEIARLTLIWFAMLSAAYVLGQRRHLAINLFATVESIPKKRILSLLLTALVAVMAIVLLVGGWNLAMSTLATGQVTPSLRVPMGYVYMAAPISGALMLVYCFDIARTALGPNAYGPNDPAGAEKS